MYKNIIKIFFIFIFICIGCSTISHENQVKQQLSQIDRKDGINKKEAILIAQNFIYEKEVQGDLNSVRPFNVQKGTKVCNEDQTECFFEPYTWLPQDTQKSLVQKVDVWILDFKFKGGSMFFGLIPIIPYYIEVDKSMGKIIDYGVRK